ncbi:MAG: type II toxin-antitoxin system RelB/DinJ family antitoxin [Clostridiales bacterium]|jgi:DNA-damage-inducible protein J|nr:type II toxin-antitoxin system RelB/DinJ family antitoxin [Clostridiales bacterium]
MADETNLNIKIDRDLKVEADRLFTEMGMNLTTAVNVFIRQAILERAIPFRINRGVPSGGTTGNIERCLAAMQEIRDLLADVDGGSIDLDQIKAERRVAKFERND